MKFEGRNQKIQLFSETIIIAPNKNFRAHNFEKKNRLSLIETTQTPKLKAASTTKTVTQNSTPPKPLPPPNHFPTPATTDRKKEEQKFWSINKTFSFKSYFSYELVIIMKDC